MKDNFKEFVNEHRKEFELYEPDDLSWGEIEKRLDTQKRFGIREWIKVAAVFVILAAVGVVWYAKQDDEALPPQVIELEAYYGSLTTEKLKFIKSYDHNIDPAVWQDLDTLDRAYNELKEDLQDDIDNEEVVSAMIRTYRAKLELLEQILEEIQNENEKGKDDEVSV